MQFNMTYLLFVAMRKALGGLNDIFEIKSRPPRVVRSVRKSFVSKSRLVFKFSIEFQEK